MKKTIELSLEKAKAMYANASAEIKLLLEENFEKKTLLGSVIERIKTWEDAAAEYGIDPVTSLPYQNATSSRQKAANAFFQLDVIAEVLREGTILDWANGKQKKWYAWFNEYKSGSGFRFFGTYYAWSGTNSTGGARLCVDTEEKARHFGTQFLPLFNQFLNPNN